MKVFQAIESIFTFEGAHLCKPIFVSLGILSLWILNESQMSFAFYHRGEYFEDWRHAFYTTPLN